MLTLDRLVLDFFRAKRTLFHLFLFAHGGLVSASRIVKVNRRSNFLDRIHLISYR